MTCVGITRDTIIKLCASLNIVCEVRRISLSEFHSAEEVFTTGTMGELTPVYEIDGRQIGCDSTFPLTARLQREYAQLTANMGVCIPSFSASSPEC